MLWFSESGINCFQFPALADLPGIFHGVFLRQMTEASHRDRAFNVGLGHGTPDAQVWENREKMLSFFGSDHCGVYARQVHGTNIGVLKNGHDVGTRESRGPIHMQGDALVTDVDALALVIQVADCQPIILADPRKKVVANVHSGWRGSIQNIVGATIRRMTTDFNCRPEDLICGVGPSLGPCCAEFVNFQDEIPQTFWKYRCSEYHFDFWQITTDQLTDAGVKPDNINLSGICTRCNPHLFFSYRGERQTGRFAAVVGLGQD